MQSQAAAVAQARQRVVQSRAQVSNARTQRQQVRLRERRLDLLAEGDALVELLLHGVVSEARR